MRPTSAAQQLASPGIVHAPGEQPSWSAFSSAAPAAGGASAEPTPRRPPSLARQPTPLLPCGLTAEELAALTASQAASNGGSPDAEASSEQSSASRRSFERVNRVASATAAARQARRRSPGPLPPLAALNWQQGHGAPPARQRSISQGQLAPVAVQMAPATPRGSAETITAAQRLAAISPGPSAASSSGPGPPSVLASNHAPGWPQTPAWAAAAPGSPRAVRSSAPARPSSWQRQVAALEALTGTHSPRTSRGGGEASAEGLEWVPGSPRGSMQHAPDPELQSVRRPGPSRLSAVAGNEPEAAAPPPADPAPASGSVVEDSSRRPAGQPLPLHSGRGSAEDAASEAAGTVGEEEEEEEAPFPEDPGMHSFSSQASAAAPSARGASPDACPPAQSAAGQLPPLQTQAQPVSAATPERPCFPEDLGEGKSAAPHALRQLSPSSAWAAAAGADAGSPPATPAPGTPRKKRGGLFSALNRILRF